MRKINAKQITELLRNNRKQIENEFNNEIELTDCKRFFVLQINSFYVLSVKSKIVKLTDNENDYYLALVNISGKNAENVYDINQLFCEKGLSCKHNSAVVASQMFELEKNNSERLESNFEMIKSEAERLCKLAAETLSQL